MKVELTKEQKDKIVNDFVQLTAKHTLELFYMLGLETHIESMIINDANGDEFIFSFKKI